MILTRSPVRMPHRHLLRDSHALKSPVMNWTIGEHVRPIQRMSLALTPIITLKVRTRTEEVSPILGTFGMYHSVRERLAKQCGLIHISIHSDTSSTFLKACEIARREKPSAISSVLRLANSSCSIDSRYSLSESDSIP